jgi:hypothetical protein
MVLKTDKLIGNCDGISPFQTLDELWNQPGGMYYNLSFPTIRIWLKVRPEVKGITKG